MRPLRPLANDLSWIVLASVLPASWVAAALATYLLAPSETSVLLLLCGVMALAAGAAASVLMALDLGRALRDIAADAALVSRELPLARIKPAVRELAAIADGFAATAARLAEARARRDGAEALRRNAEAALALAAHEPAQWRWTLATGAMEWSPAADLLLRAAGAEPSRARLLALAHPSSRADLVAWLALLARGEDAPPRDFRIVRRRRGAHRSRHATIERTADARPPPLPARSAISAPSYSREAAPEAADEMNVLLQSLAARMRGQARAAGIDFGAAILPELGPVQGPAQQLAAALDLLAESALTFTPRGGRVLLRADRLAWAACGSPSPATARRRRTGWRWPAIWSSSIADFWRRSASRKPVPSSPQPADSSPSNSATAATPSRSSCRPRRPARRAA